MSEEKTFFDTINTYLRNKMDMKNLPQSNTTQWKIIVYIALGITIFIGLQTTRILFTNSMAFVVFSIILTVLLIYFMERYIFGSFEKSKTD